MEIKKVFDIDELAQDFMEPPKVYKTGDVTVLQFDYELENGDYEKKEVYFKDVINYRHTPENKIEKYMVKAYNSLVEVIESSWIKNEESINGYKHYLVYFDGFGAYEFISLRVFRNIN